MSATLPARGTRRAAESNAPDTPDVALPRADTLTDQAYQRLHHELMTGALLPEQVLTVRGVAERYGVSLTPVREAVQRLVAERGLEVVGGRVIRVPRLDVETYREILKIRLELEPLAAREAASRIAHAEILRLEQVVARHVAAIRAGDALRTLAENTEFHLSIYRASRQPILVGIVEGLWRRVGPTLNLLFPRYCGSLTGHEIHLQVMEAMHRRDADALATAVRNDLVHGSSFLVRLLDP